MLSSILFTLRMTAFASVVLSSPSPAHLSPRGILSPTCTEIVIPVTVSASTTGEDVSGTYNIAARYCEPTIKIPGKAKTLQFLVHGATYNRDYWSGDGAPGKGYHGNEYSWINFAGSVGYPTLSIDRLCNGKSDHPEPYYTCQPSVQIEVLHSIITKARNHQLPGPAKRAFSRIIFVGHSLGSFIGNVHQAKYPKDSDVSVLTGWSNTINAAGFSVVLPAALVNPAKWGTLDYAYVAFNSSDLVRDLFYRSGAYDPALFNLDYSLRGTLAYGETQGELSTIASGFKGHVLVVTGQYDVPFCPISAATGVPDCGVGWSSFLASSHSLYPAASSFDTYAIPGIGHCWNFHYGALTNFAIVHTWLALKGF